MSTFQNTKLDPFGTIVDLTPVDVDKEWTKSINIRFDRQHTQSVFGSFALQSTPYQVHHILFTGLHADPRWLLMGDGKIGITDFNTLTDLNPTVPVDSSNRWDASLFNNIPIMNNTFDVPWTWDGLLTSEVSPIPAWDATLTCQAIRPYKAFLIALNVSTVSGVQDDPSRVLWSDSSDAGALPPSWDIADPTTLAGDVHLTSERGEIIDGLELRDHFVIYKKHSIYLMRFVGGQSVMSFDEVNVNVGLLAKNCAVEINGVHFIVTDSDVGLFDGQSFKSVADDMVRARLFNDIDGNELDDAYVIRYDKFTEVWFCYRGKGALATDTAAVWNWIDKTWSFRTLDTAHHIARGAPAILFDKSYPDLTFTYDSPTAADTTYELNLAQGIVDKFIGTSSMTLEALDVSATNNGLPIESTVEKHSMNFGDDHTIKIVTSIRPQIRADLSDEIFIRVGTQMTPSDAVTWTDEQIFTVGTDSEVYFHAKGRYISVGFRSMAQWSLHTFNITLAESGKY